jgi:osmotically-inducible protein OsmY
MGDDRWTDDERRYWDQDRQRAGGRDRSESGWRGDQGGTGRDHRAQGGYGRDFGGQSDGDYGHHSSAYREQPRQSYDANRGGYGEQQRPPVNAGSRDLPGDADYRQDSGWRSEGGYRGNDYGAGMGRYGQASGAYGGPDRGRYGHMDRGPGYRGEDYGRNRGDSWRGREQPNRDDDRNWLDKAGDEVASWLGDDQAGRRREMDKGHIGKGPQGYARSDQRIHDDVNDKLTDDWFLDASQISVEVKDGEVTLSGTIQNRQDKRRAEDIAEDVSGVKHVQNNLRVAQGQSQSQMSGSASQAGGRSNSTTGSHVGSGSVGSGLGSAPGSSTGTSTNGGAAGRTQ